MGAATPIMRIRERDYCCQQGVGLPFFLRLKVGQEQRPDLARLHFQVAEFAGKIHGNFIQKGL